MHSFKKVKTDHHILKEFFGFLTLVESHPDIQRIVPGIINRQQKGSSALRLHFSYETASGLKYKMIKGSTAQELFVICSPEHKNTIRNYIQGCFDKIC